MDSNFAYKINNFIFTPWYAFSAFIYKRFSKIILILSFLSFFYLLFTGHFIEIVLVLVSSILVAPLLTFLLTETFNFIIFTKEERKCMKDFQKTFAKSNVTEHYSGFAPTIPTEADEKLSRFPKYKISLVATSGILISLVVVLILYTGLLGYFSNTSFYNGINVMQLNYALIFVLYLSVDYQRLLLEIFYSHLPHLYPNTRFLFPFKIILILFLCVVIFLGISLSYTSFLLGGSLLILMFSLTMFFSDTSYIAKL
ncbi:MAG: hypothetical protein OXU73_02485 [Candidatus Campbellbacteria bacterium]|nr:hypothetical protein [Candidatus Campbellbacteria bacterium]